MSLPAPRRHTIPPDEQARFLSLLSPVRNRLGHFALAMTRDREDARDLVSDTVLAALESFQTLSDTRAFLSFLFTIASRLHRRKKWRARLFGTYSEEHAHGIHDGGTPPDVSADTRALYEALAHLPEKTREAIALFEISGLSLAEVVAIQGGTITAMKVRLHRGRKELARLLGVEDSKPTPSRSSIGGEADETHRDTTLLFYANGVTHE